MMREYIRADAIANAIRMKQPVIGGCFLIVEGTKDWRFFQPLVDHEQCNIETAEGKENALAAIEILNADGFSAVLAVLDADFDRINGVLHPSNVILTDDHDLELLFIRSPALYRVLNELAAEDRMRRFFQDDKAVVATALAKRAIPLGCLRLLSLRDDLALTFEGIAFGQFVDKDSLSCDYKELVRCVKNKSQKYNLDEAAVVASIVGLEAAGHDLWQIVCGYDVIGLLSFGSRKAFGARKAAEVEADVLERCLRLAYDRGDFANTALHDRIRDWESRSGSHQVLLKQSA